MQHLVDAHDEWMKPNHECEFEVKKHKNLLSLALLVFRLNVGILSKGQIVLIKKHNNNEEKRQIIKKKFKWSDETHNYKKYAMTYA